MNAEASGPVISTIRSTDDVPHRDVVEQRPVLLDRVGVVARQVHVVVDVVGAAAGREGLLEERRAAVPRPEVEGRRIGRGRVGAGWSSGWPPAAGLARDRAGRSGQPAEFAAAIVPALAGTGTAREDRFGRDGDRPAARVWSTRPARMIERSSASMAGSVSSWR